MVAEVFGWELFLVGAVLLLVGALIGAAVAVWVLERYFRW